MSSCLSCLLMWRHPDRGPCIHKMVTTGFWAHIPCYKRAKLMASLIVFCRYIAVYQDRDTVNTLRPRQNGCHFPDDIFKWIFLNENVWISIKISLKFVPTGPINNIPTLVQIMAWRRPGDKPLSEPMMVDLLTRICVARPQWVKTIIHTVKLLHSLVWHFCPLR